MKDRKKELIELMNLYGDYLKQTAFHVLHDVQLAEDMTQETFISFYQKKQFKGQSSPKTYLYSIMMNHIKMYLRKNRLDIVSEDVIYQSTENLIFEDHTINKMDMSYALNSLDYKYRETLILFYYNDLSMEEICDVLNCSLSSTKMRLKRGKEKLKVMIGGTHEEDIN